MERKENVGAVYSLKGDMMAEKGERLIWFMGKECPHCKQLEPMVRSLQQEGDIDIVEKEVWHNTENADLMREYGDAISEACGGDLGVPSFYNERTGEALCGSVTPEKLRKWAEGE